MGRYFVGIRFIAIFCIFLLCICVRPRNSRAANMATPFFVDTKPYRALLVVEQRSDPDGLVVSNETDKFQPVAALLKAWSVPFDILRVDQQHLDASYLFQRSGKIRYGTVIWVADSSSYGRQDFTSLEQAAHAGTGLIVIDSRFLDPTLAKLVGLRFKDFYTSTDVFLVTKAHYITRDVAAAAIDVSMQSHDYSDRIGVRRMPSK